jgi:2-polyprenyl-3-methyl-5-hydroxy-6-metoxy-1,4-benzoquinol methylase
MDSYRRCAPAFVESVKRLNPEAKSIIDVGCGPGIFVKQFADHGFEAIGLEYSPRLRAKARSLGVLAIPFDVTTDWVLPAHSPYDIAMSSEVAEHISAEYADAFVRVFVGLANLVFLLLLNRVRAEPAM